MSEKSSELVVPAKVLPSFKDAVAIPNEYSEFEKPEPGNSRVLYYFRKSALVTGPLVTAGTLVGGMAAVQSGVDFNTFSALAIIMGSVVTTSGGFLATLLGVLSLCRGDGYFTPFSPTKKYLGSRKHLENKVLMPFDEWDSVFDNASVKKIEK